MRRLFLVCGLGTAVVSGCMSPQPARVRAAAYPKSQVAPPLAREISYFQDQIWEITNENQIRLFGGSYWVSYSSMLLLPLQDVLVVLRDSQVGMMYADGAEIPVQFVGGSFVPKRGWLQTVVAASKDGAILRLDDGSLWKIPNYDRFDTRWWLPPYKVIVTSDQLYMIHLRDNKQIWVSRVQ